MLHMLCVVFVVISVSGDGLFVFCVLYVVHKFNIYYRNIILYNNIMQ